MMQIYRVGKLVNIQHGLAGLNYIHNEFRANEPRASGD